MILLLLDCCRHEAISYEDSSLSYSMVLLSLDNAVNESTLDGTTSFFSLMILLHLFRVTDEIRQFWDIVLLSGPLVPEQ